MSLYKRLKKISWVEYYILGSQNANWRETFRNPFYGIKQAMGTKNINAHSVIDFRMFYIPFLYIPISIIGVKRTLGIIKIRWRINRLVIFEIRRSHPVDACYYNGGFTFSFNLVNKYFPWISLNIRPLRNHYFNFGIGWEGTNEKDKEIAEFGFKFRIADYTTESEKNPGVVAPAWYEGHI